MKLIILALLLSISLVYANMDFDAYMKNYKKSYRYGNTIETLKRKAIFEANVKKINEYNKWAEENGFDSRQGINDFTDLEFSEFAQKYGGYMPSNSTNSSRVSEIFTPKAIATSWDWRLKTKVNPVKDQDIPARCGSCWAFSIIALTEISYAIRYGKAIALSEQQLIDCVPFTFGCSGGNTGIAAGYVESTGSELSSTYPYKAKKNSCSYKPSKVVAKPKSQTMWTGTEIGLKAIGPVSISIHMTSVLKHYTNGILADPECIGNEKYLVNHAVTIVGYGSQNGKEYWLVRNSWGVGWGQGGYFRLPLGYDYCYLMYQPIYMIF